MRERVSIFLLRRGTKQPRQTGGNMEKIKKMLRYFSAGELTLWCSSVALIVVSFCIFDRTNWLTLAASLVGATSLIFCAKGNPQGSR